MKRTISLFFALVLALSAVCCVTSAEETFKTPYFALTLPDGWLIDTSEADTAVDEYGEQFLGVFGDDEAIGMIVEAYLVFYEELKDVSLWNYSDAELKDYTDSLLEEFEDDDPKYLDTVMVGQIPFVLIKATDEDGEYLYADTMTNGYAIELCAYVTDEDAETMYPITEKHIEQFKSILATFQPVS